MNEIKLSRPEYHVLSYLVFMPSAPQAFVLTPESHGYYWNHQHHGIDNQLLCHTIINLAGSGLIEFIDAEDSVVNLDSIIDLYSLILSPRDGQERLYRLRLTQAGGAMWESFTNPDWSRFVYLHEKPGARMNSYVPYFIRGTEARYLFRHATKMAAAGQIMSPTPHQVKHISEWKPTYWKVLPCGFQIDCVARESISDPHKVAICYASLQGAPWLSDLNKWKRQWVSWGPP
jgi:hypothetical protein